MVWFLVRDTSRLDGQVHLILKVVYGLGTPVAILQIKIQSSKGLNNFPEDILLLGGRNMS